MKEVDNSSNTEVNRETGSHGSMWNQMHGGYFSSPEIARPFVEKITENIAISQPDVVTDLGGGTGFLLNQVALNIDFKNLKMINLELSSEQLDSLINNKIIPFPGSIGSFKRNQLDKSNKKFLFISRSTLHYSGFEGLVPLLKHIRKQMAEGEYFIHQTACFSETKDANSINLLYKLMGTNKWFPTLEMMGEILPEAGYKIASLSTAPTLNLTSKSLMARYKFDKQKMEEIKSTILNKYAQNKNGVFKFGQDGFTAQLNYKIFCCKAI